MFGRSKAGRFKSKGSFEYLILFIFLCSLDFLSCDEQKNYDDDVMVQKLLAESMYRYIVNETIAQEKGISRQELERSDRTETVIGKLGVNYELNGTQPYLTCAYYNTQECDPAVRTDCKTTIDCYLDGHHRQLACLGVFFFEPNAETVNRSAEYLHVPPEDTVVLGCLPLMGDLPYDFCSEEKCRAKSARVTSAREGETKQKRNRGGYGSCCCHTKNCNDGGLEMLNPYFKKKKNAKSNDKLDFDDTEPSIREKSRIETIFLALIGVLISVALLASGIVTFYLRKKYLKKKNRHEQLELLESPDFVEAVEEQDNDEPTEDEIKEAHRASLVKDLKLITRGRFGHVYYGRMEKDDELVEVAVKKHTLREIQSYTAEKNIYQDFKAAAKWSPAILQFHFGAKVGDELWIVTEYHPRLSLYEIIKNNAISVSSAIRIVLSMLDGLAFIHDEKPFYLQISKPAMVHRDIKSKNVLVKNDMSACLADFGLTRRITYDIRRNKDLLGQVGTRRYMSPEMLEGATEFTPFAYKQMDNYAMGLVIWEVLSRTLLPFETSVGEYKLPYQDEAGMNPHIGLMRNVVVTKKIRPIYREALSHDPRTAIIKVTATEMWEQEIGGRISASCGFGRIARSINKDLNELNIVNRETGHYHTPDPFEDSPLPPPIPRVEDHLKLIDNDLRDEEDRESGRNSKAEELIFDLATGKFITQDEAARLAALALISSTGSESDEEISQSNSEITHRFGNISEN